MEPYPNQAWMGYSVGHWEGDTLVVDVSDFNDATWFDRAGNFHSDALHVTERYSLQGKDVIHYEATITDPQVFTRPWKISMPIYRRLEPNARRDDLWSSPERAIGEALGGEDHERRHHPQDSTRGRGVRAVYLREPAGG
jgi:hypothetical protein